MAGRGARDAGTNSGDNILYPSLAAPSGVVSYIMWLYPTASGNNGYIATQRDSGVWRWNINENTFKRLRFAAGNGANSGLWNITGANWPEDTRTFVVIEYDYGNHGSGAVPIFYINATSTPTVTTESTPTGAYSGYTAAPIMLFNEPSGVATAYDGAQMHFAIINRALTSQERIDLRDGDANPMDFIGDGLAFYSALSDTARQDYPAASATNTGTLAFATMSASDLAGYLAFDPADLTITQEDTDGSGAESIQMPTFEWEAPNETANTFEWFVDSVSESTTEQPTLDFDVGVHSVYCVLTADNGETATSQTITVTVTAASVASGFEMRFLLDFDNNSWVPAGTVTGEALNLWPGPAYGSMPKYMLSNPATNDPAAGTPAGVQPLTTDYGLIAWSAAGTASRFLSLGGSCAGQGQAFIGRDDLTAGSAYTYTLWARGTATGSENHRLRVDFYDSGMTHVAGTVGASFTFADDWAQETFTFTAAGTADLAVFSVERETGESFEAYDITGMMLTPGTAIPQQYNTGSTFEQYEDITAYVKGATWDIGRTDPLGAMPRDGQLNLTLNNEDKRFSPAYAAGPLYGKHTPGNRVFVEMWDGSDWTRLFAGYVEEYQPTPGVQIERECYVVAQQGLERWNNDTVSPTEYESATAGELVAEIFNKRGWAGATNNLSWVLGYSLLGHTTFLRSAEAAFNIIDAGTITYTQLQQTALSSEQSVNKALRTICEDELGELWCGRDGLLTFRARGWFDSAPVAGTVNAGSVFLPGVSYRYGDDVFGQVIVDYDLYTATELVGNYAVNNPSSNRIVSAGGTQTWTFTTEFDNAQTTVINPFILSVGRSNPLDSFDCYDPNESWVGAPIQSIGGADECDYTYYGVWSMAINNGTVTVQVINNAQQSTPPFDPIAGDYRLYEIRVFIDQFNEAQINASAGGTTYYPYTDVWQFTARLINTEAQAQAYADRMLQGYSTPRGEFQDVRWLTGKNENGPLPVDAITRVRDWTLGTLVALTDDQTGDTDQHHVVIAESHQWENLILTSQYRLRNIEAYRS